MQRPALRPHRLAVLFCALLFLRPELLLARTVGPLTRLTLESLPGARAAQAPPAQAVELPLPKVETTVSLSIGEPNRGRLMNGVPVVSDANLLVRSDENFGTTETVAGLKRAVSAVAAAHPGGRRLVVGDLSKEQGGRIRPHKSHQSGRDIDLGYYLQGTGDTKMFVPVSEKNLDLERTWALVQTLAADDGVQYIFIDRRVQKLLRDYAANVKKVPESTLASIFEFPRRGSLTTVVRHRRGHRNHLHIRYFSPDAVAAGEKYGAEALAQMAPVSGPYRVTRFSHRIRKGETLARIAQRHRVDLADILRWNHLKRRSTLQVGQTLALYRRVRVAESAPAPDGLCHAGPRAFGCWQPSRS